MRYDKLTLDQFEEQVKDWNASLTDVVSPMSEAKFQDMSLGTTEETVFGTAAVEGVLTDQGFRSLCQKLEAPARWLRDKCPSDLRNTIFDRLMGDYDKDCLFRFRENGHKVCRAVLSDKYMTYNHLDVWEAVREGVDQTRLGQMQPMVWKPHLDDYMSLWILFDGVIADPDEPIDTYDGGGAGGLKPAIKISNSEDGTGKINLDGGLYRSYCDNGVVFGFEGKTKVEQVHIGRQTKLVTANIRMSIAETAHAAGVGIEKYIEASKEYINTAIDDVVDEWASKYKVAADTTEQWKGFVGRVQTWGDLVMATSDFGGTRKDRGEMEDFETMAGDLLYADRSDYIE